MDYLQILFFLIIGGAIIPAAYILTVRPTKGIPILAALLAGLFAGYTAIQIAQEGVVMFYTNHAANLTGIQVWWDLVMCVIIAFFFILPRAQKQDMNIVPWALFVFSTASIGLLAMCARLFWLENASSQE
ncbi:MAG: hypothetical protein ABJ205_13410 [Erythrobacter sp.]|uniref:hypothetical protein n=1 Tax=Erythrobacter sp. TaxID=1042 RepID=UPI003264881B